MLQGADAFLLVVRSFTEPAVPHPFGSTDSGRDLANMMAELALTDLEVLERAEERLDDRIKKSKATERPALVSQLETVKKVKHALDEGAPLRQQELTGSETAIIASYQLLTSKPVIAVLNTDEAGPEVSLDAMEDAGEWAGKLGQVSLCGKLEADLALMSGRRSGGVSQRIGPGRAGGFTRGPGQPTMPSAWYLF